MPAAGERPLRSGRRGLRQAQGTVFRLERNSRHDGHRAGRRDGEHSRCGRCRPARQASAAVGLRDELLVRPRSAEKAEHRQGGEGPGKDQRHDAVRAGLCHAECAGRPRIPVSRGAIEVLYAVGVITDAEADKGQVPGLERAIPKNKGVEFGSLLQQIGADSHASPGTSKLKSDPGRNRSRLQRAPDEAAGPPRGGGRRAGRGGQGSPPEGPGRSPRRRRSPGNQAARKADRQGRQIRSSRCGEAEGQGNSAPRQAGSAAGPGEKGRRAFATRQTAPQADLQQGIGEKEAALSGIRS